MSYSIYELFELFLLLHVNDRGKFDLKLSTIDDYYKRARRIDTDFLAAGKIDKPLLEMTLDELTDAISNVISVDPDFIDMDKKAHKAYSNALKKLYEFISDLKNILAKTIRTTLVYEPFRRYAERDREVKALNISGDEAYSLLLEFSRFVESQHFIGYNILRSDIDDVIRLYRDFINNKYNIAGAPYNKLVAVIKAYLNYLYNIQTGRIGVIGFSDYLAPEGSNYDTQTINSKGDTYIKQIQDLSDYFKALWSSNMDLLPLEIDFERKIIEIRFILSSKQYTDYGFDKKLDYPLIKALRYVYETTIVKDIIKDYNQNYKKYPRQYFYDIIKKLPIQ